MNRKRFLEKGMIAVGGVWTLGAHGADNPIFESEEIKAFVTAAHKDFDETQRIVEAKPLLLNCANQLKKGDFETALGGASHMGRRDIADLLVSRGARMDIFNLTFLGYGEIVKQLVRDFPQLLRAPGPHGFTLLHHAKVGEQDEMAAWLEDQGLTETYLKGFFG